MRALSVVMIALFLCMSATPAAARSGSSSEDSKRGDANPSWLGEELPLPLSVRTPRDLTVKNVAERQYLIFNLIAAGKLAWDRKDYATAAQKWETLLQLVGLDSEVERVMRPLAVEARAKAGGAPVSAADPTRPDSSTEIPSTAVTTDTPAERVRVDDPRVTVGGTVLGGGQLGPGGTVIWLKRRDGRTPRVSPARTKTVWQRNKTFIPHVVVVPSGTKVDFRNSDEVFHNVFSLNRPNDFDTGLYKGGSSYSRVFKNPGPVQVLCNIHSSMLGYVFVVDSPYYAQADEKGSFSLRGIPPGEYDLEAWHEGSSKNAVQRITVDRDGISNISVRVTGDKKRLTFVPDKYGKPRQPQLGY